jgi:hypothetical protein
MKKCHGQRTGKVEAESLALRLCCNDVSYALCERGRLPKLRDYARLPQRGMGGSEWQLFSNSPRSRMFWTNSCRSRCSSAATVSMPVGQRASSRASQPRIER